MILYFIALLYIYNKIDISSYFFCQPYAYCFRFVNNSAILNKILHNNAEF